VKKQISKLKRFDRIHTEERRTERRRTRTRIQELARLAVRG
jgi:hypothetical protein